MEASIPPFLVHLGLDTQADERAIRRAYAQRLKRVDQANEPHVFQALREAYETALRWCDWRRQAAEEEAAVDDLVHAPAEATSEPVVEAPLPAAPVAEPAPNAAAVTQPVEVAAETDAPPSPQMLADAVFAVFAARRDQGFSAEAQALDALEAALADDRLVNLEARAMFEWQVACTLVEGWRPGHEFLFGPACTVFNWERERRALAVFGRVGATLNAAIDERLMFFRLPPAEFDTYRQVVQRLRNDAVPDAAGLMRSVPIVRMLAQRYPHWLRLITSQANFTRWDKAFEAIPGSQHEAYRQRVSKQAAPAQPERAKEPFQKRESSFNPWWLIFAVLMVARLVSSLSDSTPHSTRSASGGSTWPAPPAHAPAARSGEFSPLFDLSTTVPVAPRSTATKSNSAADSNQRPVSVEAELKKLQAESLPDGRRGYAIDTRGENHVEQPAEPSPPQSADAYLEQQRKKLHAVEGTLPELGGSVLSPNTGAAPRLSFDLTEPADAASAPPAWAKPTPKL